MTEEEWLNSVNATEMLWILHDQPSDRKSRLYACAVCRRILKTLQLNDLDGALLLGERFAEGDATDRERLRVLRTVKEKYDCADQKTEIEACRAVIGTIDKTKRWDLDLRFHSRAAAAAAAHDARRRQKTTASDPFWQVYNSRQKEQAAIFRDIFGNPFRPVAFDPRWRSTDATALARGIYEERAFERLPLLADALMDAGCGDEQVLSHCRGEGPHVRGCWVVDLVLGKE
jgi:hypothetical protein